LRWSSYQDEREGKPFSAEKPRKERDKGQGTFTGGKSESIGRGEGVRPWGTGD